jgi:flagellar biosynthesis protein FlhG
MMNLIPGATDGRPLVWAVGGGKGGTGKSLLATSLGIHLAEMGRRVVLVDGDLGAPNLHTFLGLDAPRVGLADFISRDAADLQDVAVETGVPRLRLISGARNPLDAERLKHFQKTRLMRRLIGLPADVVLVDLGAGITLNTLDFFSLADHGLMVILPEPTSVENCWRFLAAAYLRRLRLLGRTLGFEAAINLVLTHRGRPRPGRPVEALEEVRRVDSFAAEALASHLAAFVPSLVINQARDHADVRLGESMQAVSERFLRVPVRFAGAIPYDPVLVRSIKSCRPFLVEYPRSRTAEAFRGAAETIASAPRPGSASAGGQGTRDRDALADPAPLPGRDPYGILGLRRGAPQSDVISAYMRLRPALRSDSPALASLDCEAERRAELAEVEEAFRALSRNVSAGSGPLPTPRPRAAALL